MTTDRIARRACASMCLVLLALAGPPPAAAEPAPPGETPAGCPCWTFAELAREFLDNANDIYCITDRFETEIISRRAGAPTGISSAGVMPQLFNDPETGRCNASFENVGLFRSSFVADPFAIAACLDDLDRLRERRACR